MNNIEEALVQLVLKLQPNLESQPHILRNWRTYQQLLIPVSSTFSIEDSSRDSLDSDQYRWADGLAKFSNLQTLLNEYLESVYKGTLNFKIGVVGVLAGDIRDVSKLMEFILRLYLNDHRTQALLDQGVSKLNFEQKKVIAQFISPEEKSIPTENPDNKRKLLDKIDELQEELDQARAINEEQIRAQQQLSSQISKLKSTVNSKDVEIANLTAALQNQKCIQEVESEHLQSRSKLEGLLLQSERQICQLQNENIQLKAELVNYQQSLNENKALRLKAALTVKLEQKLDHCKDMMTQEREDFTNQLKEKEKIIQQLQLKTKQYFEQIKSLEGIGYDLELEKQKLFQQIEQQKEQSTTQIFALNQKIHELEDKLTRFQLDAQESCRSSLVLNSPIGNITRNLEADILLALEQNKNHETDEKVEDLHQKYQKQISVLQEKLKTEEAKNFNLQNDNYMIQTQKQELEQKNFSHQTQMMHLKNATDEEIMELVDSKHQETMLLASLVYDLQIKNQQLKAQLSQNITKKVDQKHILKAKN